MSRHHKKHEAEPVEPDLPITPMLDMSFQLMAFFVFTFRPMPSEGQITLALPKQEGTSAATEIPDFTDEKPDLMTVTVSAAENGAIQSIVLRGEDGVGGEDLGASSEVYFKKMKERIAANKSGKPGKLAIEIDPRLIHQYVVKLIDEAVRAGYTDIAPTPIKAGGGPAATPQ
jgi:biopolymer transport protein ExbD